MKLSSRAVATVAAMTLAITLSASPAFAQGQVERGPENARSICSFSGLNDDPTEAFPEDGRTQSYGQLVKKGVINPSLVKSGVPSPGTLCNPNNLSLK
jgi:hypothetical protein